MVSVIKNAAMKKGLEPKITLKNKSSGKTFVLGLAHASKLFANQKIKNKKVFEIEDSNFELHPIDGIIKSRNRKATDKQ